jgi:hypothetical protein
MTIFHYKFIRTQNISNVVPMIASKLQSSMTTLVNSFIRSVNRKSFNVDINYMVTQ